MSAVKIPPIATLICTSSVVIFGREFEFATNSVIHIESPVIKTDNRRRCLSNTREAKEAANPKKIQKRKRPG